MLSGGTCSTYIAAKTSGPTNRALSILKLDLMSTIFTYQLVVVGGRAWDDDIRDFCRFQWPGWGVHWSEVLDHVDAKAYEDEFVLFVLSQ